MGLWSFCIPILIIFLIGFYLCDKHENKKEEGITKKDLD